jgi:hypothetical protein
MPTCDCCCCCFDNWRTTLACSAACACYKSKFAHSFIKKIPSLVAPKRIFS